MSIGDEWQRMARGWIDKARFAPSSHNTQPWRFVIGRDDIQLHANRHRALPVNDPDDRELMISCGAALFTLRLAAAADGISLAAETFPEPGQPEHLAQLRIDAGNDKPPADLLPLITERRTTRKAFLPNPIDPGIIAKLESLARQHQMFLVVLTGSEQQAVADLIWHGDLLQWANPAWRDELATWMRTAATGMGLTQPALIAPFTRFVVRHFNLGKSVADTDWKLAKSAPLLAVLCSADDQPLTRLRVGEALQHLLLEACRAKLQAGYLNQPIQLASLRIELKQRLQNGDPQILLRMGYVEAINSHYVRLPVDELLG